MKLPELLLPAGSWEQFQAGMLYGGDAFYLTVGELSLRATAKNFSWETLKEALTLAHKNKKRIYFCLNLLPYEKHLSTISKALEKLTDYPIDGLIIADPGVFELAKSYLPNTSIHLSTQANTSNSESVKFWHRQGASRVNLARELSYKDIRAIREHCPEVELELFVHGAMCMSLSGRCLLSAYLNQRSANLGKCAQPCRFLYKPHSLLLEEEFRHEKPIWELQEDNNFSKILSVDDLCLVKYLKWFITAKINSIKVEGRTKTAGYVAHVADVYKTALNDSVNGTTNLTLYLQELAAVGSRPLTTGFFLGKPQTITPVTTQKEPIFAQLIEQITQDKWIITIKEQWKEGSSIKLMLPGLKRPIIEPKDYSIENNTGYTRSIAHPGTKVILRIENPNLTPGMFLKTC